MLDPHFTHVTVHQQERLREAERYRREGAHRPTGRARDGVEGAPHRAGALARRLVALLQPA